MNPLLILLGLGVVVAVASKSSTPATKAPPAPAPNTKGLPGGGPQPILTNCRDALAALPAPLQEEVVKAASSGSTVVIGQVADKIEAAGMHDAADCLRQMGQIASGPPSAQTCDAYLNDVPDVPAGAGLRTQIRSAIALASTNRAQAVSLLTGFEALLRSSGQTQAADCVHATVTSLPAETNSQLTQAAQALPSQPYRVAVPQP